MQLNAGKFGTRARDIFEDARAADPQNALYYRSLAFVHEGLGESTRAAELYAAALNLHSGDSLERQALLNQRMHWLSGAASRRKQPLSGAQMHSMQRCSRASHDPERRSSSSAGNMTAASTAILIAGRDIGLWAGLFGAPFSRSKRCSAAIGEQGGLMPYMWLPQLAPMRRLPEFKAYMRDIGMVDYWKEYGWPEICHHVVGEDDFECS